MKPLLLLDRVDLGETPMQMAARRGEGLRAFCRRLRKEGRDTVGMVDDALSRGLTRKQAAETLGLCLAELPGWEERARARRWEREAQARLRRAFAAE